MSPRILIFTINTLLCAAVIHAADESPAGDTRKPAKAEAPYQLKNRSAFASVSEDARAPFWPIGWVKQKAGSAQPQSLAPRLAFDGKSFKVTSILIGNPSLAVINGRAYSEGEFLRMPRSATPAPPVRIRVQQITDGSVTLQYQDQMIVASLVRGEFKAKVEDQLLLDER